MPLVVYAHMATRCDEVLGRTKLAELVGCDVEDMRRICRGHVAPSSRQRDVLDVLFASLLAVELEGEEKR